MRYLPHTESEIQTMLQAIGVDSIDDLFQTIPPELRLSKDLDLPPALDEEGLRRLNIDMVNKNVAGLSWISYLGAGAYSHIIPSALAIIASRSEFVTAYTPYQAEVSQGTLQSIFEFQTMIADIFNMEIANASVYDGSTATTEAALMALRVTKKNNVLITEALHPEYKAVLKTYLKNLNVEVIEVPSTAEGTVDRDNLFGLIDNKTSCFIGAYPNFFGVIEDFSDVATQLHDHKALFITTSPEILALGLAKSPGEMGADIAVGEGRSLGVGLNFGGPSLGLFATRKQFVRQMPGRLVGETVDNKGQRSFVVTLSTREQHIRREKATSNICTNVALCALYATITLALWGKEGFERIAQLNWSKSELMKQKLSQLKDVSFPYSAPTFNEFVVELPLEAQQVVDQLTKNKILAGVPLNRWQPNNKKQMLMCVTEKHTEADLDTTIQALEALL